MHLLHARTRELQSFVGDQIPPYAILSHTWGQDEISYHDLTKGVDDKLRAKAGYVKIRHTCQQALEDGLQYCWVDTCCIDKSSSAELSEAINSMFRWYERAAVCYVHLPDFRLGRDDPHGLFEYQRTIRAAITVTGRVLSYEYIAEDQHMTAQKLQDFAKARWFRRGWTLQELIAPRLLVIFDKAWIRMGQRDGLLLDTIVQTTRIDVDVLCQRPSALYRTPLSSVNIARKMSWAATRQTTRREDEAYCLLGIFGINMPLLYGEEHGAFERLQKELIRTTTDLSVFAWQPPQETFDRYGLLAPFVEYFRDCNDLFYCPGVCSPSIYELTTVGLRISLPIIALNLPMPVGACHGAVMGFRRGGTVLVLVIYQHEGSRLPVPTFSTFSFPRLHFVEVESVVNVPNQDVIIATRGSLEHMNYGLDTLHYAPGVWLRVRYPDWARGLPLDSPTWALLGLQLDSPTPLDDWDILHLKVSPDVGLHAHLKRQSDFMPARGRINMSFRSCTWKVKIHYESVFVEPQSGSSHPALVLEHIGNCDSQLSGPRGTHEKLEWHEQELKVSCNDKDFELRDRAKTLYLDELHQLKISFKTEVIFFSPGWPQRDELVIELQVEPVGYPGTSQDGRMTHDEE